MSGAAHLPIKFKRSFQTRIVVHTGKYMDSGNLKIVNVMFHQLGNFQTETNIVLYFGT